MKKLIFCLPALFATFLLHAQITFTRITDASNPAVTFTGTAAPYKGAVWIDLDHDRWPDLFVSQKFLFHNLGNGNFEQLSDVAGVTLGQGAAGSSWGDLNNDGHPDCISASVVSGLHYNSGDNTFEVRNSKLPEFDSYRAWDCSMADADNNGLLDLFWAHADNFPPGSVQQPCKLYLQVQPDSFVIVKGNEFSELFKPYTIPIWTDIDLDGDMDLLIGTGPGGSPGPDFCYRNMLKETGSFSLVRLTSFPFDQMQDGQVYNAVDFDNDGDMDLCLTNYSGAKTRLYRNDPGGYTEIATPFTVVGPYLTNTWGDFDNDGDLDVLISADGNAHLRLYINNNGAFASVENVAEADAGICGIALADYDNDGDLDAYSNGANGARALFRNDTPHSNHWVEISLTGVQSNRAAIGALLRVKATINGQAVWQIRELNAHNSFQGQNDLRQHFGLGNAQQIDSVEIRWPSGLVQKFGGLAVNNFYEVKENESIEVLSTGASEPNANRFELSPNPFKDKIRIVSDEVMQGCELFDSTGRIVLIRQDIRDNKAGIQVPSTLPKGNYFMRIHFENGQSAVKTIVKI